MQQRRIFVVIHILSIIANIILLTSCLKNSKITEMPENPKDVLNKFIEIIQITKRKDVRGYFFINPNPIKKYYIKKLGSGTFDITINGIKNLLGEAITQDSYRYKNFSMDNQFILNGTLKVKNMYLQIYPNQRIFDGTLLIKGPHKYKAKLQIQPLFIKNKILSQKICAIEEKSLNTDYRCHLVILSYKYKGIVKTLQINNNENFLSNLVAIKTV